MSELPFRKLYSGMLTKLTYNLPVLSGIYTTSQVGNELQALFAWSLTALLYPLNILKVRSQISNTLISSVNVKTRPVMTHAYRGVVPYILLNAAIGYTLRPLFSKEKLLAIK